MNGLEYVLKLFEITQQELAEKLGIKQQNIDLWIRDKSRKIPKKHLPKLVEIFNIPEEYFQKELKFYDEEKIQIMKLHGISNYEEPKYIELFKKFIVDEDEEKSKDSSKEQDKQEELTKFNYKREELIKSIQKILDLGLGNTNYSPDIVTRHIKSKGEELDLIKSFLDIYNDSKEYNKAVLSKVIASFKLFQGKELPYKYTEQNKIDVFDELKEHGYDGEMPDVVDKESLNFIYQLKDLMEAESKRIKKRQESIAESIKIQEEKIAKILSKLDVKNN